MGQTGERVSVDILGREVHFTHLDKVLFPATGFTKGHLMNYYARIAPYVLPHLKQRPLTLKMYQQGIRGRALYVKNAPSFTPIGSRPSLCHGDRNRGRFVTCSSMICLH
jgi:bifunctional non-homologous end joining protein LigD